MGGYNDGARMDSVDTSTVPHRANQSWVFWDGD
jgi:hypothetical protein